jgi:N-acetylglucosaminyldiphosphoundecaprenol N-acetyl-beta-D-mannosaminyltransferase
MRIEPIESGRTEFLGLGFDPLGADQVLARLAKVGNETPYGFVVTPNVDHIVRLHDDAELRGQLIPAYGDSALCLCDSKILGLLARARGILLPVVPGSELTRLMFERVIRSGDRVAIVGGDAALLRGLEDKYKGIDFVQHCPPMGLRRDSAARTAAAKFVARSGARFTFIAVGSPQQEMIAAEAKAVAGAKGIALCVGASLEFLTGRQKRAPRLAQQLGLEWAHRLLSDPRRLWRRYLLEGPRVFLLTYRWPGPPRHRPASK